MPVVKINVLSNEAEKLCVEAIALYITSAQSNLEYKFAEKLQQVNWGAIVHHHRHAKHGYHWSKRRTLNTLIEYFKFLFLVSIYHPQHNLVPQKDVDTLWHTHIFLNTASYAENCKLLFGEYLHHASHSTLEEDQQYDDQAAFDQTALLLEKHFGTKLMFQNMGTSGPIRAIKTSLSSGSCGPMPLAS